MVSGQRAARYLETADLLAERFLEKLSRVKEGPLGKMVRPPSEARTERRASVILFTLGEHRAGERFGASVMLIVSSTEQSVKLSERVDDSDEKRRGTGMFWLRLCLRPRCFCGLRDTTTPS
jgi:hypothetical protein